VIDSSRGEDTRCHHALRYLRARTTGRDWSQTLPSNYAKCQDPMDWFQTKNSSPSLPVWSSYLLLIDNAYFPSIPSVSSKCSSGKVSSPPDIQHKTHQRQSKNPSQERDGNDHDIPPIQIRPIPQHDHLRRHHDNASQTKKHRVGGK